MPFLRFARDKRGYETTALVHAFRGRQGRTRQKVLYWFRTPPGVKVGRPALDQEAIRWIEEHNPDIEFDWPRILEATPAPAAPDESTARMQKRRGRFDRGARGEWPERRATPRVSSPPPASQSDVDATPDASPENDEGFEELAHPEDARAEAPQPQEPRELEQELEEEALEQVTHPDAEKAPPETVPAVESVLGREQLIRFRARYAELQARIIERGGEPARVEALRAQAEGLDPDSWVTIEEARTGLESFEPKIRELRAALGLRRRRRSRRGGRKRRGQTSSSQTSSNSSDAEVSSAAPEEAVHDTPENVPDDEDENAGGEGSGV